MTTTKHYVVWRGRKPGIYTRWDEVQAQIIEYPHARYKSYDSYEEAKSAFEGSPPTTRIERIYEKAVSEGRIPPVPKEPRAQGTASATIYCAGDCRTNPGPAGVGVVLKLPEQPYTYWYGLYEEESTGNRAELRGLQLSLLIAQDLIAAGHTVRIVCDNQYAVAVIGLWSYRWKTNGYQTKSGMRPNVDLVAPTHELFDALNDQIVLEQSNGTYDVISHDFAELLAAWAILERETGWRQYDGTDTDPNSCDNPEG